MQPIPNMPLNQWATKRYDPHKLFWYMNQLGPILQQFYESGFGTSLFYEEPGKV